VDNSTLRAAAAATVRAMTFVIGSYRAVEHPGGGHRASAAGLWRGEDLRTLGEVAMTVLPADCAEMAHSAVESVAAIRHPHLLPVIEVSQNQDRVAVVCPWPAGGRLAELVLRRGRLTAAETLTVLIPVADALAAAHAAGIRHGEVCPEALWFDAHGRPLLGAPAVSRLIAELNDGLPAGSRDVAPEVIRGEKPPERTITSAADVFSLGSVALYCLTGRSAWPADDAADVLIQSAAGLWPDLPDEAAPPEIVTLVREMLRAEPDRRPSAAGLAARLGRAGEPAPIAFGAGPTPTPASANRWRGWGTEGAPADPDPARTPDRQVGSAGPDDDRGPGPGRADGSDPASADGPVADAPNGQVGGGRRAGGRRAGGRRAGGWARLTATAAAASSGRQTPLARAGIALLVGLLVTVVAVQIGLWWTGWEEPTPSAAVGIAAADAAPDSSPDPAVPAGPVGNDNWSDVVVGLDAARGRALDTADPALLADVYLDSTSAAGAADAAVVAQLADNGLRVVDGVHQIVSVTVDGADPTAGAPSVGTAGDSVRLAVVDTLPAHPIVDVAGQQVGLTAARAEQRRILVLHLTPAGYRISSVEAG
jgi:hypothetical protein